MNGTVRRRGTMQHSKSKSKTYVYTDSIVASTGMSSGIRHQFNFKIGATYVFNIEFSGSCTYIKVMMNHAKNNSGNLWGNTVTYTYAYETEFNYPEFYINVYKPTTDGIATISITESF